MSAVEIDAVVAKGAAFLRKRLRSGVYGLSVVGRDTARASDNSGHIFAAAFIAEAMTGLLDEIDRSLILVRILSEENEGLWGYSPPERCHREQSLMLHVDSDDSAYALRTLQRLGINRPPTRLLSFYRKPERMFVTFDSPAPPSLTTDVSVAHNLLAHPEVNANIFLALQGTHLEEFVNYDVLLQSQHENGFWPSYFYPSPLFGTQLALDVFHAKAEFAGPVARALSFIVQTQNADGSWGTQSDPYEAALAVAALAGRPEHKTAMDAGVDYLLSSMAPDGSWASQACVWEFQAGEGDVWRAFDVHRVYVTARCLTALRRSTGALSVVS
ncbi:MAG TPA: hypothetical protein VFO29_10220 [Candidatus Rubrimentiphilum sp.]|nr:hypothetical protein [Candidatus Rubrimentiphilum sp.]